MRDEPPPDLVQLLESLRLATAEEIRRVARRARRLAKEIPLFESVWVDALAQARVLTPFQAAEINAGRGTHLAVGPYVIREPLTVSTCGRSYAARDARTLRHVVLLVVERSAGISPHLERQLAQLVDRSSRMAVGGIVPIEAAQVETHRVWAACPRAEAQSAADWMVRYGRFPTEAVLEIARQMAQALAALDPLDLVHGDLSAAGLLIQPSGHLRLLFAGLRGVVRPVEGYGCAELRPEAYDYLAPERIADGTPPTPASDLYACGLLWCHLLTGRPPLAGGNSLAKIKASQSRKRIDVRQVAPDVPSPLEAAIRACLEHDVQRRPATFSVLAQMLGPPTRAGRCALARCFAHPVAWHKRAHVKMDSFFHAREFPVWLAGVASGLVITAALAWPAWRRHVISTRHATPPARSAPHGTQSDPVPNATENQLASFTSTVDPRAVEWPDEVLLPADVPLPWDQLTLRPGQTIRGADRQRPRIRVPAGGLTIGVERLRLLNIDFVADRSERAPSTDRTTDAIVLLQANEITLEGCAFQGHANTGRRVAGIAWDATKATRDAGEDPAPVRLAIAHCTFHGVDCAIGILWPGTCNIQIHNTLHLGPGPLVRLFRSLPDNESIRLSLTRCTLRDAAALIELAPNQADGSAGPLAIEAVDCVFAPKEGSPLVRIHSNRAPGEWLRSIDWQGQGCLLTNNTPFAAWHDLRGTSQAIDDDALRVHGLVRATFQFRGPVQGGTEASQVSRWSGPLKSDARPGIHSGPPQKKGSSATAQNGPRYE
jgi:hypothetical protein